MFSKDFDPNHGEIVEVSTPGKTLVRRITATNTGAFTYTGTNSYIVGRETLAIIDPGPDDPEHLANLLGAIGEKPVSHIFVSHTHMDHSPLAAPLAEKTGAVIVAEGPHRAARTLYEGEINHLEASTDKAFKPDILAKNGSVFSSGEWEIEVIHTPGHMANHSAFALKGEETVFTADHIMGWATSIIAPPDGSMGAYMNSLDIMLERHDRLYLPGHGGPIESPEPFVRALKSHRILRERAIFTQLQKGERQIEAIVKKLYAQTDPRLHGAAALSVLAHMEDLIAKGEVVCEGPFSISSAFTIK